MRPTSAPTAAPPQEDPSSLLPPHAVPSPHQMIINIATMYARVLVGSVLSLFASRYILAALGVVDFGLSPITSKCTTSNHFKVHHFGWVFSAGLSGWLAR